MKSLYDLGWIKFWLQDGNSAYSVKPLSHFEGERIASALTLERKRDLSSPNRDYLLYGLTKMGGAKWEQLSLADWETYVLTESVDAKDEEDALRFWNFYDGYQPSYTNADLNDGELERRCIRISGIHRERCWERAKIDIETLKVTASGSVKHREIAPWNATYWKDFPYAYRITYTLLSEIELPIMGAVPGSYSELDSNRLTCDAPWYIDPFTNEPLN